MGNGQCTQPNEKKRVYKNVWVSAVPGSACLCISRVIPLLLRATDISEGFFFYLRQCNQAAESGPPCL